MDDIKVVGLASSKNKGKTNWKVIGAIIGIVVLSIGVIAGIILVRQQQDVREKAAGNCDNPSSIVQCPRSDGALVSCTPPDANGNAQISLCDSRFVGRPEVCGGTEYCCNGTSWVTDMTACSCNAKAPTSLTTSNLTSTSVTLKWTAGTGGKYGMWVSKNSDPMTCSSDSANCVANDVATTPTTTTEYALTNLTPNTKYYWRIMAWTKEGCDSATSVVNFTTSASGSVTPTVTSTSVASATPTATSTSSGSKTATPTVTSTSKATATSTSSGSKTATPTVKPTATGSGTAFPVPETGADLPTMLGVSFGIVMILVSLGLAL